MPGVVNPSVGGLGAYMAWIGPYIGPLHKLFSLIVRIGLSGECIYTDINQAEKSCVHTYVCVFMHTCMHACK